MPGSVITRRSRQAQPAHTRLQGASALIEPTGATRLVGRQSGDNATARRRHGAERQRGRRLDGYGARQPAPVRAPGEADSPPTTVARRCGADSESSPGPGDSDQSTLTSPAPEQPWAKRGSDWSIRQPQLSGDGELAEKAPAGDGPYWHADYRGGQGMHLNCGSRTGHPIHDLRQQLGRRLCAPPVGLRRVEHDLPDEPDPRRPRAQ
jgi:hypothetical protein